MIWSDTRAVSIALNYSIAIAITTILTTGLIIGAGNMLENQQERVARQQANEIGADLLSQADKLDRIGESTNNSTTTVELRFPSTLVGSSYAVAFRERAGRFDGTEWILRIDSPALAGEAAYPVPGGITVEKSSVRGPDPELSLCRTGNITFGGC